jgi:hypothetical protein
MVLADAIAFGNKVLGRGADLIVSSQFLQAYFLRTCWITCTRAGMMSSCSLISSPISSN